MQNSATKKKETRVIFIDNNINSNKNIETIKKTTVNNKISIFPFKKVFINKKIPER